jgi:peptidyl-prolyl cis-trans isomerase C
MTTPDRTSATQSEAAAPRGRVSGLSRIAAIVLLALPIASACAQNTDPVVARVNGVEIRESDLSFAEDDLGNELRAATPDAKREQLIAYLADIILVAKAAEAKKLQDSNEFKQRLVFLRNKLLMGLLLQSEAKAAITEEAARKLYDEAVKPAGAAVEIRARHILFRVVNASDEKALKEAYEKAKAAMARLDKEDFAAVAMELTDDPSGKANGGDLGYFTQEQMVPEFAQVAFQMEPGKIAGPVRTAFGWHIIKVEDKRNKPVPAYEQVKPQIEMFLARKAQTDFVTKLRAEAKIERLDTPAAAPPQTPQAPPQLAPKPGAPPPALPSPGDAQKK